MTPSKALIALHEHWADINDCTLKSTASRAVFGYGNASARVVFIGEAPGKKEDATGVPFVGAAGRLLDEMLTSIKMDRIDIYITNIVKYRPPNNRDPSQKEKDSCRSWLHAELALINPVLIVFLGRHAMNDFFPEEKISRAHGNVFIKKFTDITTTHYLPLYHPAAALYNGGLRGALFEDFKQIPIVLKKLRNKKRRPETP